ncbi:MAG: metal-sensing transcriptional repressor [Armatimonadetes bacterium]|nr:metal-sensing transcriptional repressor [Armatimonadota bacterium]
MSEHKQTKQVVARLARVEGHGAAVKRMVEEGRSCTDVLVQIAAVRSALDKAAKLLLSDHMEHCVLDSLRDGDAEKHVAELREALERFIS